MVIRMSDVSTYYDLTGGLGNAPVIFDEFLDRFVLSASDQALGDGVQSEEPPEIEVFALSPITSSSGLKGILLDVLGPYDNIVTQYRYQQNTSSNWTYVNEVTPDYPWIFSAVLFIVLLCSVFRLFGRCFRWMR